MTLSSKDAEEEKKNGPPASYAIQNYMKTWRKDYGRNVFTQRPANAVQDLISIWRQGPGKSLVSQIMPANVLEGLIGISKQDFSKSAASQLVPVKSFGEVRKSWWGLSSPVSQSLMGGILSTNSISSLFDAQQFNWASTLSTEQTSVVRGLAEQYLVDEGPVERDIATDLEDLSDEEAAGLFRDIEEEPWADPVHAAFISFTAEIGVWLEDRYPHYKRQTIDTLSEYVSRFLHEYFVQCLFLLGTLYGPGGLAVVVGLFTAVGMIPKKEGRAIQRDLSREMALEEPCGYCGADIGVWCFTKGGSNPGSRTTKLHKPRWQ